MYGIGILFQQGTASDRPWTLPPLGSHLHSNMAVGATATQYLCNCSSCISRQYVIFTEVEGKITGRGVKAAAVACFVHQYGCALPLAD